MKESSTRFSKNEEMRNYCPLNADSLALQRCYHGTERYMKESYKEQCDFIPINSIPWDSSWPRLLDGSEKETLLGYLEERFGIPTEVFEEYCWFKREKTWWMVRASPLLEKAAALRITLVGLRAFTKIGGFIKPTTRMIQVFGKHATKSRLEVGMEDVRRLLAGETLRVETEQGNGYVILSHKGDVLGLGLLLNNLVRSQLPRQYKRLLEPFFNLVPRQNDIGRPGL